MQHHTSMHARTHKHTSILALGCPTLSRALARAHTVTKQHIYTYVLFYVFGYARRTNEANAPPSAHLTFPHLAVDAGACAEHGAHRLHVALAGCKVQRVHVILGGGPHVGTMGQQQLQSLLQEQSEPGT